MAIIKTNISEVEEVFAKLDLALICEEKYQSLKQFDWVVYAILKNQEGLSKRSYLMGNKSYVDKYNNVLPHLIKDKNNHIIDNIRYRMENEWQGAKWGWGARNTKDVESTPATEKLS